MISKNKLKINLCNVAIELNDKGFNHGATGNCSIKTNEGFLITPSGVLNRNLTPEMMVELDMNGERISNNKYHASSEWLFHKDLYQARSDISSVIHTHTPFATALSSLNINLKPFHYMIAVAGGEDVRCADYSLFGTQQLSNNILKAIKDRKACFLANHGLVTIGVDIDEAYDITEEIEHLSQVYINAKKIAEPALLSDTNMKDVLERFKSYSRWRKD